MRSIASSGTNIAALWYVRKKQLRGVTLNFVKQEIALYSNPQTGCFEHGLPFLAKLCDLKENMMRVHLRALRDEGVIEVIRLPASKPGQAYNHYRIIGLKEHLNSPAS